MLPLFLHHVFLPKIAQMKLSMRQEAASVQINVLLALFPYLTALLVHHHFIFISTLVFRTVLVVSFPILQINHARNAQHHAPLVLPAHVCPASQPIISFSMPRVLALVLHLISHSLLLTLRHAALALKAAKFARMVHIVIPATLLFTSKRIRHRNYVCLPALQISFFSLIHASTNVLQDMSSQMENASKIH